MQGSKIISYSKDDFYLIKNSTFKKGEFIGKVKTIETSCANLSVFIFPEDTKDGRKGYMSTYEVFYTKNEIKYTFTGNEKKVFVLDFEEYIKKKYILKEKFTEDNIYFKRQNYDEKSNSFYPYLQKTCYCQKYFNPDSTFKTCGCGNYFHPACYMKSRSNKCWNPNCNVDCSIFFNKVENEQKKRILNSSQRAPSIPIPPPQKSVEISETFFSNPKIKKEKNVSGSNDIISLEEFAEIKNPEVSKKTKKVDKAERNAKIDAILSKGNASVEKRIKQEPHVINLSGKEEKTGNIIFDTTIYTRKSNQGIIKLETFSYDDLKKKTDSEREKARNLFYSKIMDGINILKNDKKFLDDFAKEKPDLIPQITFIETCDKTSFETKYKELANSIEKNLFEYCNKKTSHTYLNFLREFTASMKNSITIIYRLILGDISAEEISRFKPDDFLPEEKKKEKEELIRKAVQSMEFKEPMVIRATQVKGRMLTEIQDNIEIIKPNYIMDMMLNLNAEGGMSSEYHQKIKKMKEQYPNMSDNDVKFLVDAKEPNIEEIQNKLNSIIQENLNLEEQKELFSFRQNKFLKKAERFFKKKKDVKNVDNKNENIFLGNKFMNTQDYIQSISLDIKPY